MSEFKEGLLADAHFASRLIGQFSKRAVSCRAPAKINCFLRIFGRLTNGYHAISTLIAPISLADEISLELDPVTSEVTIQCDLSPELRRHLQAYEEEGFGHALDASLQSPDNLAVRAANAVLDARNLSDVGLRIRINKLVPLGAGLGGGSGNAAALIVCLDRLLGLELTLAEALSIASKLGADVSAQLLGTSVFAWGVGGGVLPLSEPRAISTLRSQKIVLLKPPISVDSAGAYAALSLDPVPSDDAVATQDFARSDAACGRVLELLAGAKLSFVDYLFNDFEKVISSENPLIQDSLKVLGSQPGVRKAMLTGSGSAVVGFLEAGVDSTRTVESLVQQVPEGWFVRSAHIE